jgi:protein-S-isoprenylcysteine O-methyltransferase Ste14
MDAVRYYISLMVVVTMPPAFAFWFVVHPFIGFWRRLGTWITYAITFPLLVLGCYAIFQARGAVLGADYGTRAIPLAIGTVLYAAAAVVEVKCRRYLTLRTLVGVPELKAPEEGPGSLLCEGIYAQVRHPRYVGVMLGGFGMAFLGNYLGGYLVMAALIPVAYALTVIEEVELRQRFGDEYVDYRQRVPRFFPHLR